MFYYNKKIVYMNLLKNGNKIKNAGFLRWEETEETIRWTIRIKGLYDTDTGYFDLLDDTGALVDKILLKKGEGNYSREFAKTDQEGKEKAEKRQIPEKISGIQIRFADGRRLVGRWDMAKTEPEKAEPAGTELPKVEPEKAEPAGTELPKVEPEKAEPASAELFKDERVIGEVETVRQREEKAEEKENSPTQLQTSLQAAGHFEKTEKPQTHAGENVSRSILQEETVPQHELYEDKWEQLQHMYPTVHPFRDDREFLSITPGDFVILERSYQKMVNNSFLLHGYYNYRHVILGKYSSEGEEIYYLGVPGVYYDREKMAAEMFGFEAFEGKNSPAEPGSFGYYMKRVKI